MSDSKGGIPFSGNGEYYIPNYSMCKKPSTIWGTVRVALGSKVAGTLSVVSFSPPPPLSLSLSLSLPLSPLQSAICHEGYVPASEKALDLTKEETGSAEIAHSQCPLQRKPPSLDGEAICRLSTLCQVSQSKL